MKRWLAKIVVFLLLGAIVNVAVAWGCYFGVRVANQPGDQVIRRVSLDVAEFWLIQQAVGRTRVVWDFYGAVPRQLGEVRGPADYTLLGSDRESRDLAGYPLRSLWSIYSGPVATYSFPIDFRVPPLQETATFGPVTMATEPVRIRDRTTPIWKAVPLRPIWLGFAINTVFYALILSVPFAPFTLRRLIRRKRGHCIKCGYDLRGDFSAGCPKCGWRREAVV
ncbi:MAG: hypothetical protein V3T84_01680 [Phycisphaerales bacterium]